VRALLRRTPLRVKLVALVVALVTATLATISVTATLALRSYLVDRLDEELIDAVERVRSGDSVEIPLDPETGTPLLPSDFIIAWRSPLFPNGVTLSDLRYSKESLPPVPTEVAAAEFAGEPYSVAARDRSSRWRVLVSVLSDRELLVVAQNMSDVDNTVNQLIWIEVLVGAAVLALLAGLGAATVRRSLRPLVQIERTADAIARGDLTRRVPEPDGELSRTELDRLARALNTMLEQIETAFAAQARSEMAAREAESSARQAEARARFSEERMRQFVADASHELRTPLTTIRGFAELFRQGAAGSPDNVAGLLGRIEREAARMGLLVQDLLLLARLDQQRPLEEAPVDLAVVVSDAVLAARAVDPERPITLTVSDDAGPVVVRGDDARLRQVVGNLLNNALTHTPVGTPVAVRLCVADDFGMIEVSDQGPGLAPEQAERVFERFYRVDAARGRPTGPDEAATAGGGTGLGLAIVAALVAAHGGTVELDTTPGQGASFRIHLPLATARELSAASHQGQPQAGKGDGDE
jgi:two-component system OmpR family sensor kinase